jgi:hypothetical protein
MHIQDLTDLTVELDAEQVTNAASTPMTTMHWESLIGALPSVQNLTQTQINYALATRKF